MGVVGRPHGVRGLVHVHSYTADPAALAGYAPLHDDAGRAYALRFVRDGIAEIARIEGGVRRMVASRAEAETLVNTRLLVDRAQLPQADDDEFYLSDLVGLEAVDAEGSVIGRIEFVHDYGAGVSLEIGRHVVPFTKAVVPEIDLSAGRVTVCLPAEIEVSPGASA